MRNFLIWAGFGAPNLQISMGKKFVSKSGFFQPGQGEIQTKEAPTGDVRAALLGGLGGSIGPVGLPGSFR